MHKHVHIHFTLWSCLVHFDRFNGTRMCVSVCKFTYTHINNAVRSLHFVRFLFAGGGIIWISNQLGLDDRPTDPETKWHWKNHTSTLSLWIVIHTDCEILFFVIVFAKGGGLNEVRTKCQWFQKPFGFNWPVHQNLFFCRILHVKYFYRKMSKKTPKAIFFGGIREFN